MHTVPTERVCPFVFRSTAHKTNAYYQRSLACLEKGIKQRETISLPVACITSFFYIVRNEQTSTHNISTLAAGVRLKIKQNKWYDSTKT